MPGQHTRRGHCRTDTTKTSLPHNLSTVEAVTRVVCSRLASVGLGCFGTKHVAVGASIFFEPKKAHFRPCVVSSAQIFLCRSFGTPRHCGPDACEIIATMYNIHDIHMTYTPLVDEYHTYRDAFLQLTGHWCQPTFIVIQFAQLNEMKQIGM